MTSLHWSAVIQVLFLAQGRLGLEQQAGDHGLADVVEQAGDVDDLDVGELHQGGDVAGQDRDPDRVLPDLGQARRDRAVGGLEQGAGRRLGHHRAELVEPQPGHRGLERARRLAAERDGRRRPDDLGGEHRVGLEHRDQLLGRDLGI